MPIGTVKFFNHKNKFGFIIDDETKKEYYVHAKEVEGMIDANDRVQFELKPSKKGEECSQIRRLPKTD